MFFIVTAKLGNSCNSSYKKNLKEELLLRSGHNQNRIDSMKETILSFLNQKYCHEYDDLVNLLPKLNAFLIHCQQNPEDDTELTCSDCILNINVVKEIKKYTGSYPPVRPMTLEENYIYRDLVDKKGAPRKQEVLDRADTMDDNEREKLLYRPYHDEHLCS